MKRNDIQPNATMKPPGNQNPASLEEQNALRVRVAELCGWTIVVHKPCLLGEHEAFPCAVGVPDYPNDLNACAEFEKGLTEITTWDRYRQILQEMCGHDMLRATATQTLPRFRGAT